MDYFFHQIDQPEHLYSLADQRPSHFLPELVSPIKTGSQLQLSSSVSSVYLPFAPLMSELMPVKGCWM